MELRQLRYFVRVVELGSMLMQAMRERYPAVHLHTVFALSGHLSSDVANGLTNLPRHLPPVQATPNGCRNLGKTEAQIPHVCGSCPMG